MSATAVAGYHSRVTYRYPKPGKCCDNSTLLLQTYSRKTRTRQQMRLSRVLRLRLFSCKPAREKKEKAGYDGPVTSPYFLCFLKNREGTRDLEQPPREHTNTQPGGAARARRSCSRTTMNSQPPESKRDDGVLRARGWARRERDSGLGRHPRTDSASPRYSQRETHQCIRQPRTRVYLGAYHTRLCRGPSANDMENVGWS